MNNTGLKQPQGLGGWLIFVAIGLFSVVFMLGGQIVRELLPAYNSVILIDSENVMISSILLGDIILGEIVINAGLAIFAIYIIYLFFEKDYRFPKMYIIWYLLLIFFTLLDWIVISILLKDSQDYQGFMAGIKTITRVVCSGIIWISYMLKSVRVKNTFVNGKPITS